MTYSKRVVTVVLLAAATLAANGPGNLASAADSGALPAPSPSASPTPQPTIRFMIPPTGTMTGQVLYVIAVGGGDADAPTRGKLVAGLTEELQKRQLTDIVVPEPNWGIGDFIRACNTDKMTDGALVVGLVAYATWSASRIFQRDLVTAIDANVLFAKCQQPTTPPARPKESTPRPTPTPSVAYTWQEQTRYDLGDNPITNLSSLALLLPLAAIYEIVAPTRTTTSQTTTAFPVSSPPPASGSISSIVTTNSTAANANGAVLGAVASASIAGAESYTRDIVYGQPTGDLQTWRAVVKVAQRFAIDTLCPVKSPATEPSSAPTPDPWATRAPFCELAS